MQCTKTNRLCIQVEDGCNTIASDYEGMNLSGLLIVDLHKDEPNNAYFYKIMHPNFSENA